MRASEFTSSPIVSRIDTPDKVKSTLEVFTALFGHIDVGQNPDGSARTVSDELAHVDWKNSVGVFQGDRCSGALAMSNNDLMAYLTKHPDPGFKEFIKDIQKNRLSSAQGEALYIDQNLDQVYVGRMFRRIKELYRNRDYLWGLAHVDLNNLNWWQWHSIPVGLHSGQSSYIFCIPLNARAKQILDKHRSSARPQQRNTSTYISEDILMEISNRDYLDLLPQLLQKVKSKSNDMRLLKITNNTADSEIYRSFRQHVLNGLSSTAQSGSTIRPGDIPTYEYWIYREYVRNRIEDIEDIDTVAVPELALYHKYKNILPLEFPDADRNLAVTNSHNIMQVKYGKLYDICQYIRQLDNSSVQRSENRGKSEEIISRPNVRVIKLLDQVAAEYYGQGSRWCTSSTRSSNPFEEYAYNGPLYVIIARGADKLRPNEKYQLHIKRKKITDYNTEGISVELRDERNISVSASWLFRVRFSELFYWIHLLFTRFLGPRDNSSNELYIGMSRLDQENREVHKNKSINQHEFRNNEEKNFITSFIERDYHASSSEEKEAVKKRFLDIATRSAKEFNDYWLLLQYARITGSQNSEIKNLILNNLRSVSEKDEAYYEAAKIAYLYARDVMHSRWQEIENLITDDSLIATKYTEDLLRGDQAEIYKKKIEFKLLSDYDAIDHTGNFNAWHSESTVKKALLYYVRHIMRHRWAALENKILEYKDTDMIIRYAFTIKLINGYHKFRWPEGEKVLLANADPSELRIYTIVVVQKRWKAAEDIIRKDENAWRMYESDLLWIRRNRLRK